MRCVLYLLEHIRLALLDQIVKFLLSSELVNLELPLQLLLLLDLFLCGFQIAFQVKQEVRLLDHLKSALQFVVLLHQIDDRFVCILQLALRHCKVASVQGSHSATIGRLMSPGAHALPSHALASDALGATSASCITSSVRQSTWNESGADAALDRPAFFIVRNACSSRAISLIAH